MSEEDKTVVEEAEDGSGETVTEAGDAQDKDTLDEALAEYEASEKKPERKDDTKTESEKQPDEVMDYIRRQQAREVSQDIDAAVKAVKGDDDLDDRVVRALLNDEAQQNPRFMQAWSERHTNPKGWDRVLKAFRSDIDKMVAPKVDKDATEDTAAVRQAVRGASTKTSGAEDDVPDFRGKSDHEFQEWLAKQKKAS